MELNERKKKILQAVVRDYIKNAEPVGSRTISRKHIPQVSSATIRNEMADLEEMGYLQQPHTSAGRIPSDLGYRVYVDSLMEKYKLSLMEMVEMKQAMERRMQELENMIRSASKVLSEVTNYAAVAMIPELKKGSVRSIQIVYIDERRVIIILVTNENIVKNKLIVLHRPIDTQIAVKLSNILNTKLLGCSLEDITLAKINEIVCEVDGNREMVNQIMDFISEVIGEIDGKGLVVDGSINLLNFPEYSDITKAREILEHINDKTNVKSLAKIPTTDGKIRVLIGKENPVIEFQDCSVILSEYHVGDAKGVIGVIGPTRMDYAKVISTLEYLRAQFEGEKKALPGNHDERK